MKIIKKILVFFPLFSIFHFLFSAPEALALSDKVYKDLATFTRIMDIVDRHYVDKVDEREMMMGAIKGMLFNLDPHTVYLPAEIYKDFKSDTKGRFGGVGIEVTMRDGYLTIVAPLEGSPAHAAGLKAGDKILSIDGRSTRNMNLGEAVHLMRGPIGRKVALTVRRRGLQNPFSVSLKRDLIRVESVKVEDMGDGYGFFRVTSFQEGTAKSLKKAIDDFEDNHGKLKGIILDMRDNPGGLLSEAVRMSDLFLEKGVIVSTKGREKIEDVKKARSTAGDYSFPVVILINHGTASASEIVSGALQDQGRAKIMGTKSYGKGSVQTVINLDGGDAIKITIARYYTPKNRMIDGKGIEPDIKIDQKAFQKIMSQMQVRSSKKPTRVDFMKYQQDEAFKYLKKMN